MTRNNMIKQFIKNAFNGLSFIRNLTLNIIFIAAIVIILQTILSKKEVINENSILEIKLPKELKEKKNNRSNGIIGKGESNLFLVIKSINKAKTDPRIRKILINMSNSARIGQSQANEIMLALQDFKKSQKEVVVFSMNYNKNQYLIASTADKIVMDPLGMFNLSGYSITRNFYKNTIEKLKLTVNVFKKGNYKSSPETYTENKFSEYSRENYKGLIDDLWDQYMAKLEENRLTNAKLPILRSNITQLLRNGNDYAMIAFKYKIIDEISTIEEIKESMVESINKDNKEITSKKIKNSFVSNNFYEEQFQHEENHEKPNLAIIIAEGAIIEQKRKNYISSDYITEEIEKIAENKSIKAIVLRLNTGGGGVIASEKIRRKLIQIKNKHDIKIVVSMGDMTASGGYWVSTAADYIMANSNTITGSIGVYSIKLTAENTKEDLGVATDSIQSKNASTQHASIFQKLEKIDIEQHTEEVTNIYHNFLNLVSKSRNISISKADDIAQGQLWTGNQALKIGLIDEIGTLNQAIIKAAELAEIEKIKIFVPYEEESIIDYIKETIMNAKANIDQLNEITEKVNHYKNILENNKIEQQLYCDNCQVE